MLVLLLPILQYNNNYALLGFEPLDSSGEYMQSPQGHMPAFHSVFWVWLVFGTPNPNSSLLGCLSFPNFLG